MLRFNVVLVYFAVLFRPAKAVTITNTDYTGIQTGTPFTITWTDASGLVTVILRYGNSTDPDGDRALHMWAGNSGTSYIWTPTPDLPTGPYLFELADSSIEPVFSPQFTLTNVPIPSSATTTSPSPLATFITSTSSPSPSTAPKTTSPTAITPTAPPASTSTTDPESTPRPHAHLRRAIKAGICVALVLLVLITTYFSVTLLRNRCLKKRGFSLSDPTSSSPKSHKHQSSDVEMMGGRAEMSGGLDSASSVGSSSRDASTRGTSSRGEVIEVNKEPVEIGSSGFGKMMSESEKKVAVEVEANQRIKFEERKRRRKGVKLLIGSLRMLF